MNNYEFYVLSGNTIVAKWKNKTLTVFKENLLPLYLKQHPNAEHWIASRAIDSHRVNARLLKKALRLKEKDDLMDATRYLTIMLRYAISEEENLFNSIGQLSGAVNRVQDNTPIY